MLFFILLVKFLLVLFLIKNIFEVKNKFDSVLLEYDKWIYWDWGVIMSGEGVFWEFGRLFVCV